MAFQESQLKRWYIRCNPHQQIWHYRTRDADIPPDYFNDSWVLRAGDIIECTLVACGVEKVVEYYTVEHADDLCVIVKHDPTIQRVEGVYW